MLTQNQSPLGILPREVRDMIYVEYLLLDAEDGYFFDFEACKLRTSSGKPIDLGLMYTCILFAHEMRGLALRLHTITFSTIYSSELRSRAGRWDYLSCMVLNKVYSLFQHAASRLSHQMRQYLVNETTSRPLGFFVKSIIRDQIPTSQLDFYQLFSFWGEVPSLFREDLSRVLKLALTDPSLRASLSTVYHPSGKRDPAEILRVLEELWMIPTEEELDEIAYDMLRLHKTQERGDRTHGKESRAEWQVNHDDIIASGRGKMTMGKYRFSAASAAIFFFSSDCMLRSNNIKHLRSIILREDHESVAYSECHIRGLLPFQRQNPALRVERRVSLWRNIFLKEEHGRASPWNRFSRVLSRDGVGQLSGSEYCKAVARWMAEASLESIIPPAFTLLLDGDPISDRSAELFRDAIQADAAWQTALERSYRPPADSGTRERSIKIVKYRASFVYNCVGFPDLLKKLSQNHTAGRVRCNFDPGGPWSDKQIAEVIEANQGCPSESWDVSSRWYRLFETSPPLPPYYQLLLDAMLPQFWNTGPPPSMRAWLGDKLDDEAVKQKTGGHRFLLLERYLNQE